MISENFSGCKKCFISVFFISVLFYFCLILFLSFFFFIPFHHILSLFRQKWMQLFFYPARIYRATKPNLTAFIQKRCPVCYSSRLARSLVFFEDPFKYGLQITRPSFVSLALWFLPPWYTDVKRQKCSLLELGACSRRSWSDSLFWGKWE